MYDYLIRLSVSPDRWTALQDTVQQALPAQSSILEVTAYSDLGDIGTLDDEGNILDPGVPATVAPGVWFIASLPDDTLPEALLQFVQAKAERGTVLLLPTGIAGLSTVWAGMQIQPGNPA